jgi:hypothetical protein
MRVVFASLCFVALAVVPAAAQERPAGNPAALDQVYQCASITDQAQRLACYDSAVGRLREAQTSGDLVAVDRAQAQEVEREAFGFSLPSLPRIFGRGEDGAEPEFAEMQLTLDRVVMRRDGTATFYMTNGQVWTQVDNENPRNARAGGEVTIRRASLGSFLMSLRNGPALRVRRTQ